MRFFNPQGNPIDIDEFVKIYEQIYFYLSRHAKISEKDIDDILAKNKLNKDDFVKILEWKTGCNCENGIIVDKRYRRSIKIDDVYNAVQEANIIMPIDEDKAHTLLVQFIGIKGIGLTYAITVLYFLSHGRFPIYDTFANIAIHAINSEKKPGEKVNDLKPICFRRYQDFCDDIKNIFGKGVYETDRKYDRALWAYGHLFG